MVFVGLLEFRITRDPTQMGGMTTDDGFESEDTEFDIVLEHSNMAFAPGFIATVDVAYVVLACCFLFPLLLLVCRV